MDRRTISFKAPKNTIVKIWISKAEQHDPYASHTNPQIALRRFVALAAAAVMAAGSALIAAPSASAAKADLVVYFDRTFREVVDVGTQGTSHGDITVTNGNVSNAPGGKSVGSYSTSQITASVLIPGGRENRKTDIGITARKGVIYTTALVKASFFFTE